MSRSEGNAGWQGFVPRCAKAVRGGEDDNCEGISASKPSPYPGPAPRPRQGTRGRVPESGGMGWKGACPSQRPQTPLTLKKGSLCLRMSATLSWERA